jgi:hypothetical protein
MAVESAPPDTAARNTVPPGQAPRPRFTPSSKTSIGEIYTKRKDKTMKGAGTEVKREREEMELFQQIQPKTQFLGVSL